MAIDDRNPEYIARLGEWIQMRDTYDGEHAIKRKRLDYLPPMESMIQDGMNTPQSPGWRDYEAYLMRAYFHDVVKDAVRAMVGIMHMKPAVIKLPKRLAGMVDKATVQGEGLQMLLRRINEAQLVYGRLGLLVDAPTGVDVDKVMPYISVYEAERIINWDAGRRDEGRNALELVVLDESGLQREGFTWVQERKWRILARGMPNSLESGWTRPTKDDKFQLCVKVNDMSMPIPTDFITPSIGGKPMDDIPFVFIGSDDLVPEPAKPPLLGLSNLALAIYRGEADYRQTLYMQGQGTLVIIGNPPTDSDTGDQQLRVGNKGLIEVKQGGDAKYIAVSAAGLSEMRQAIKTDSDNAAAMGTSLMDAGQSQGESGEALRLRVAAKTTTIATVAKAGGAGLEQVLKYCAVWVGEDPEEVSVQPTIDFADQNVQGAALLAFMQAKQLGLPLSLRSMHRMMNLNDMTELDFEAEILQIEAEAATYIGAMVHGATFGMTDESYLDTGIEPDDDSGDEPAHSKPGLIPKNMNVPIKPHVRGSPKPLKVKVGKKGASAGK